MQASVPFDAMKPRFWVLLCVAMPAFAQYSYDPSAADDLGKPGYLVLRVTKRPPPRQQTAPVQVDCLLRRQVGND